MDTKGKDRMKKGTGEANSVKKISDIRNINDGAINHKNDNGEVINNGVMDCEFLNERYINRNKEQQSRIKRRKRQIYIRFSIFLIICLVLGNLTVKTLRDPWGMLRVTGYPQALIEKAQNYPEAREYVLNYKKYKGKHMDIDVSNELVKGEIPHFLQWDKRWGYENYGTSFIGVLGCGPTALSMVYCGLTGDASMHPQAMAQYAEENGYYVQGSGTSWDFMSEGAEELGLIVDSIGNNKETILEALSEGKTVISIMTPGDFTVSGHFIVLTGVDSEGKIEILDANSVIRTEKTWELDVLISQMAGAWAYSV